VTEIPARFEISGSSVGPVLHCTRPDCTWFEYIGGTPLTEVVAVAREHVEEEHRD
jgi:hypothetical protein